MLVPRPDRSTPTRTRSAIVAAAPVRPGGPGTAGAGDRAAFHAGLYGANTENGFSRCFKCFRDVSHIIRRDDHGHADAAVEGPRHLLRLDMPLGLQESHQP